MNVYDNVLMGGYSVGTWCDNPFDGKPFDNTEENDYAPVKNFRIVNNEYLSPCDLLSIRPTNFITDCGLHSSETFRNGDFAHGHTYWTMEGDAGEQDGSGYARGEGRLYEGLYLKKAGTSSRPTSVRKANCSSRTRRTGKRSKASPSTRTNGPPGGS